MNPWIVAWLVVSMSFGLQAVAAHAGPVDTLAPPFECSVRPSASPLRVGVADMKGVTLELTVGQLVYPQWTPASGLADWAILHDERPQLVEPALGTQIDCSDKYTNYPVVFVGPNGRERLRASFGIANDYVGRRRRTLAQCPDCGMPPCVEYGAGQASIRLSHAVLDAHARDGIDRDKLCVLLSSGQIRYDPESGQRLPTYVILTPADPAHGAPAFISDEYLFWAPKCFARAKVTPRLADLVGVMHPIGCRVLFHPWSGRRLSPSESAYFTEKTYLWVGGEGGGSIEDSQDLANDPSRRVTSAKIEGIKAQLPR